MVSNFLVDSRERERKRGGSMLKIERERKREKERGVYVEGRESLGNALSG